MAIINRLSRSGRSRTEVAFWILFFGLLVLGGLGYGIYHLILRSTERSQDTDASISSPTVAEGRPRIPSGWKQFTYAESGFSAWFPTEPARKEPDPDKPAAKFPYRGFWYRSEVRSGVMVRVGVYPIDADVPREDRNDGIVNLRSWLLADRVDPHPRVTEWCGMRCLEFVEPVDKNKKLGGISRLLVTKTHFYCVSILGFDEEPPADLRAACFDGFHLLSSDAVDRESEAALIDLSIRWEEHEFIKHKFKARFSGRPETRKRVVKSDRVGEAPMATTYFAQSGLDAIETNVMVLDLKPGLSKIARAALIEELIEGLTKVSKADARHASSTVQVTLDGRPAQEMTTGNNKSGDVVRFLSTEYHMYLVWIGSRYRWPTDEERKLFFDSFHLLK
jgi:hypothetical protein